MNDQDLIQEAYSKNVPMGGDIIQEKGKNPRFLVWAISDPLGAPLQRVQIIKGWLADGEQREKVFDVACSDGQSVNPLSHRCPDNGAKVNLDDCSISREKFRNKDFLARMVTKRPFTMREFLKTPLADGQHGCNKREKVTIQERAWSSPIWIK